MSEIDINKYISGDLTHYTDPNTGITWHNAKFVQQLKQENKRLKQECDLYKTWYRAKHDDLKNFLGQLKAENEELKNFNENIKIINNYCVEVLNETQELLDIEKLSHKSDIERLDKYKNALDEIKHILEVNKRELDECLFNDIDGKILQKIKEVKEGINE